MEGLLAHAEAVKQLMLSTWGTGSHAKVSEVQRRAFELKIQFTPMSVTDSSRLSQSWYQRVLAEGTLSEERYVELLSVTVLLNALDVGEIEEASEKRVVEW